MKKTFILFLLICSFQVSADRLSDSNKLFNWAEQNFPEHFPPSNIETIAFEGYLYRYYELTNVYIGTLGEDVYVFGDEFNGLLKVGKISDFVQLADDEFNSELLANYSLFIVSEDRFEEFQITFQQSTYNITTANGENKEGNFFTDDDGSIFLGDGAPSWTLVSTSNVDFIQILEVKSSDDEWQLDSSFDQATLSSFNNDINQLKNYFLENGLWETTITENGVVNKFNSNTKVDGKWSIEGNIFYFNYPDEETGGTDSKAYKLENGQLYFSSDAKYSHSARLYYDQNKAHNFYNQLISQ